MRGGEGGGYSAKCSSDPKVANPEVKVQVRDRVRVVDIVTAFAPRGSVFRGKSFYRAPGGKWTQETCTGCPQQWYATGEPGKIQGRDRVGIVEGSVLWVLGQYSGKIRFIEKPGVQD